MPGYAPSLTTLETVKSDLGLAVTTYDDVLTYLIKVASDAIANRCNRNFTYSAAWVENVPSYGQTRLVVTHTPVLSVTGISYRDSDVLSTTDVVIADAGKGWLTSQHGWMTAHSLVSNVTGGTAYAGGELNAYRITYAGGYVTPQQAADAVGARTLPYDLEHACVMAVGSLYRGRGQDRRISSEGLLSYNVSYREVEELPEVASVIRRYRRIGTGR